MSEQNKKFICKSNGNLYENIGFCFDKEIGPNYWWVKNKVKYHRSNFMKYKLVAQGYDVSKSENEIMYDRGYVKLWGNGNLKYILKKRTN